MKKICFLLILLLLAAPCAHAVEASSLQGGSAAKESAAVAIEISLDIQGVVLKGHYSGQLEKGLPQGQGVFITSGWAYTGAWEGGHPHGWGVTIHEDGEVAYGIYEEGQLTGSPINYPHDAAAYLENTVAVVTMGDAPAEPLYTSLVKGDRGDAVLALQERLDALQYPAGTPDGVFGSKTQSAVLAFQQAAGLPQTGIADSATQAALFDIGALENPQPVFDASSFGKLDYDEALERPTGYRGQKISFSGRVVQVVEEEGLHVTLRVASRGDYENVMLVRYERPMGSARILEEDRVQVYAIADGLFNYASTLSGTLSIPACEARQITVQ